MAQPKKQKTDDDKKQEEILDLNYLFEDNNKRNDNDKDLDMIADDNDYETGTIGCKCVCGVQLIAIEAADCYDECKAIECDQCANTVKGNTIVYHCKNGKTTKHEQGYDLCALCALGNDKFDDNLFQAIYNSNKSKNFIISPFSILTALTITMCGAAGNTLKEMLSILYPSKPKKYEFDAIKRITNKAIKHCKYYNKTYDKEPMVKIANKIWIKKECKVLDEYIAACQRDNVALIDISNPSVAARIVNEWCAQNTNNMIQKVVTKDIMSNVELLIANAIYFNGKFEAPFEKKHTYKNISFYKNKKREKELSKVRMMHSEKRHYFIQKYNGIYDVVKLLYKHSDLSLILAMNEYSVRHKKLFSVSDITDLNSRNEWKNSKLKLFLPKFKFEYECILNSVLQQMGIRDAFSDSTANFARMSGDALKIGLVIHKAIVEVDEIGTKAAAVTVVAMKKKSCARRVKKPKVPTIRFDHPFSFFIFDEKKNSALFSGWFVGSK